MDKLVVKGGARLKGRVEISGSKNSALPILAATLLTPETCVLHNVPDLSDIRFMLEILRQLGAKVTFENGTVTTRAEKVISEVPYDLVRKMRASICVLGPDHRALRPGHDFRAGRLLHRRPAHRHSSQGPGRTRRGIA